MRKSSYRRHSAYIRGVLISQKDYLKKKKCMAAEEVLKEGTRLG